MPKIQYRDYRPRKDAQLTIARANEIIERYKEQGYTLTLRQMYYRFVANAWIENNHGEYRKLGATLTAAREGGLVDWNAIEDRGRTCYYHSYQDDALKVLKGIERGLGVDPWADQDYYVEYWVEKQALEMVIARGASTWRTPYMACKGYLSASESWRAGLRFADAIKRGKKCVLFHLGDRDPSGVDMTRDNQDRMDFFVGLGVDVRRLALNQDQIDEFNPPPNYAKETDSRYAGYKAQYGENSYELDALEPGTIVDIMLKAIDPLIDKVKWEAALARERELRKPLALLGSRWEEIQQLVLSDEKPLERLARLEALIGPLGGALLDANNAVVTAGTRYGDLQQRAAERLLPDQPENVGIFPTGADNPKPEADDLYDGAELAIKEIRSRVMGYEPRPEITAQDDQLARDLRTISDQLERANERTPYEAPDLALDNEYEPKDPDDEVIDDEFGDRY